MYTTFHTDLREFLSITAGYQGTQGAAIFDLFGMKHLSYGWTLILMGVGVASLFGLPLAGLLSSIFLRQHVNSNNCNFNLTTWIF